VRAIFRKKSSVVKRRTLGDPTHSYRRPLSQYLFTSQTWFWATPCPTTRLFT